MDQDALLIAVHSFLDPGPRYGLCLLDCSAENGNELIGVYQVFRAADDLVIVFRNYDDGRRPQDVETLAQIEIRLDPGGECAGWVDDEGHLLAMLLEPPLGELVQIVLVRDRRLRVEYIAAKFVGQLRA